MLAWPHFVARRFCQIASLFLHLPWMKQPSLLVVAFGIRLVPALKYVYSALIITELKSTLTWIPKLIACSLPPLPHGLWHSPSCNINNDTINKSSVTITSIGRVYWILCFFPPVELEKSQNNWYKDFPPKKVCELLPCALCRLNSSCLNFTSSTITSVKVRESTCNGRYIEWSRAQSVIQNQWFLAIID